MKLEHIREEIKMRIISGEIGEYFNGNDVFGLLDEYLTKQEIIFKELIQKQIWEKNKDSETNQTATKIVEFSGGINSVIDRHNDSLNEILKLLNKNSVNNPKENVKK